MNLIFYTPYTTNRVYYGNEGKKLNLIDIVGEFNDAINLAAKLGGIENYQIIKNKKIYHSDSEIVESLIWESKLKKKNYLKN